MNTTALHQAIRLYKYPKEMEWLTFPESELPDGVTDLLRLCASHNKLNDFATLFKIKEDLLRKVMIHFIEEVLLTTTNPDHKYLGLNSNTDDVKRKLHYQLLMKIYHPDRNPSESAADKASKITSAYKKLNKSIILTDNNQHKGFNNDEDPRTPPASFYRATQKAELSLNRTKHTFYFAATLSLLTLAFVAVYFASNSKPELVVQKNLPQVEQLPIAKPSTPESKLEPRLASSSNVDDLVPTLESLVHDLEKSYELGKVENIQPILANSPEISGQSTQQISAKLKTLFEITQQRKMVLYNISWKNIAGTIQGEGKFISRYKFNTDKQWLVREGNATIKAVKQADGNITIESLQLNSDSIDQ